MEKRRRCKRLPLSIPVRVYGRTPDNMPFRDITETKDVSVQGGLVPLTGKVECGQKLLLVNGFTGEERECRVVYVETKRRSKARKGVKKPRAKVGVEFTRSDGDFWHVFTSLAPVNVAITEVNYTPLPRKPSI